MKKLRNFKCKECEHAHTQFASDETIIVNCPECKGESELTLSAPKYFNNSVGRSPSAM